MKTTKLPNVKRKDDYKKVYTTMGSRVIYIERKEPKGYEGDRCACCNAMVSPLSSWIHLTLSGLIVAMDEDHSRVENSQGLFHVCNSCEEKIGPEFVIKTPPWEK